MSEPVRMPLDAQKQTLLERSIREARTEEATAFRLPLQIDLAGALSLIGNLQLALRHPANQGESAQVARAAIDAMIGAIEAAGLAATAEIARLGDDPAWDGARGTGR